MSVMAPTKFASVRYHGQRPMLRPSFRDDTSLVALRYEKTIAAEPPIHIAPRSPRRAVRPASSSSSSASSHQYSPVVVAPPAEEHPALRTSTSSRSLNTEEWKRDSGHAPAGSPTTIYEEDCEEDDVDDNDKKPWANLDGAVFQQYSGPAIGDRASAYSQEVGARTSSPTPAPEQPCAEAGRASPRASISSSSYSLKSPPQTPGDGHGTLSKKLSKTFSLRSVSSMLRRRSTSDESTASASTSASTEAAQGRGSVSVSVRGWAPPPLRSLKQQQQQHPPKSPTARNYQRVWIPALKSPNPSLTSSSSSASSSTDDADTDADARDHHPYAPLVVSIPSDSLLDDDFINSLTFSNRGSVMFGGRRPLAAANMESPVTTTAQSAPIQPLHEHEHEHAPPAVAAAPTEARDTRKSSMDFAGVDSAKAMSPPDIRVLTADVELESQKVRSLYDSATHVDGDNGEPPSSADHLEPCSEVPAEQQGHDAYGFLDPHSHGSTTFRC
jgi:hypothetical protein